jgi:ABC-2 type transport system permease protein
MSSSVSLNLGPVVKARGFKLFWAKTWARAYPRIVGTFRERSWVFFETVLPVMATASYVFVYRAIDAPADYVGFAVVGGAMTAFWLNVLWSMASQLYWDKDLGNLELYVLSPGSLMAILVGMSVGGLVMSGTRAIMILVLCTFMFNVTFQIASIPLLIFTFLLTMIALYGMGMLFASVFLATGREAFHLSNLLQEPIYLISGFYFPIKELSFWVATAASVVPLSLGIDAMRQLIFKDGPTLGFLSVTTELLILVALCVIFVWGAKGALEKMEELGRRDGRLIERRR